MKSTQDVVSSILASWDMKDILVEHREDIAQLVNAFLATIYVIGKPREVSVFRGRKRAKSLHA